MMKKYGKPYRQTNLAQIFPIISAEWHPLKNGTRQPSDFTRGSHYKAWWRCKQGHEWESVIQNRTGQKQGCPYCAGKRVCKENSLAALFPEVAKEWHPTRNAALQPSSVRPSTHQKVWWQCNQGHSWQVSPKDRTGPRKSGCPVCHNLGRSEIYRARALKKKESLAKSHPALVSEWHSTRNDGRNPTEFVEASNWLAWWRCQKGHEWQARISKRAWGAQGCPFCSNKRVAVDNNLATNRPDLAFQWHPSRNGKLNPSLVTFSTGRNVWWRCPRGHSWRTSVYSRSIRGSGCPFCSNASTSKLELRVLVELKSIFPLTSWRTRIKGKEVDVLVPEKMVAVEIDGYPWHQRKVAEDKEKRIHLKRHGYRLIRLRDSKLLPLRLSKDDVVYDNNTFKVLDIQRLVTMICGQDIPSRARAYLRRHDFADDRSYRKIIACLPSPPAGESLADAHPELLPEWDFKANAPLIPSMFTTGSGVKVAWKCTKCNHKWHAVIGSRATGRGCPRCMKSLIGERRSQASIRKHGTVAKHSRLMPLWYTERNQMIGLEPDHISVQSPTRAWWRCPNGHVWETEIRNLFRGTGCMVCYRIERSKNRQEKATVSTTKSTKSMEGDSILLSSGKAPFIRNIRRKRY